MEEEQVCFPLWERPGPAGLCPKCLGWAGVMEMRVRHDPTSPVLGAGWEDRWVLPEQSLAAQHR